MQPTQQVKDSMNAWSHLPNAHHINWVLKSLKENPNLWSEARDMAWLAAWNAARVAARTMARDAVYDLDRTMAWNEADGAARSPTWCAAWDAIVALVAYDDCDQYLQMKYEQLKMYAVLSEKPQAVLLLPMVYVREKSNECLVTSA